MRSSKNTGASQNVYQQTMASAMSQEKCTVLISKMEVFMRFCADKDSLNGKVEVQEESKAPDLVPADVEMKDEETKVE